MTRQTWQERADDDRLPLWLRVFAVAMAHEGRADLERAALQRLLQEPHRQHVARAVQTAVVKGWLAEGSSTTRLVAR